MNAALRLSDGYCICMNGEINLIFHREEHAVVCGWRYLDFFFRDGDKNSGIFTPQHCISTPTFLLIYRSSTSQRSVQQEQKSHIYFCLLAN